jgi:hypothetical protein
LFTQQQVVADRGKPIGDSHPMRDSDAENA